MGKQQRRNLPWSFMVGETRLDVHCGSGHWAEVINRQTGETVRSIYVYEATQTKADGTSKATFVPKSYLAQLRRYADDPDSNVRTVQP